MIPFFKDGGDDIKKVAHKAAVKYVPKDKGKHIKAKKSGTIDNMKEISRSEMPKGKMMTESTNVHSETRSDIPAKRHSEESMPESTKKQTFYHAATLSINDSHTCSVTPQLATPEIDLDFSFDSIPSTFQVADKLGLSDLRTDSKILDANAAFESTDINNHKFQIDSFTVEETTMPSGIQVKSVAFEEAIIQDVENGIHTEFAEAKIVNTDNGIQIETFFIDMEEASDPEEICHSPEPAERSFLSNVGHRLWKITPTALKTGMETFSPQGLKDFFLNEIPKQHVPLVNQTRPQRKDFQDIPLVVKIAAATMILPILIFLWPIFAMGAVGYYVPRSIGKRVLHTLESLGLIKSQG